MKTVSILSTVLACLCLAPGAFAQASLNKAEIQDILRQLTSQPRKTWISAGTIEATHVKEGAPSPGTTKDEILSDYQQKVKSMPAVANPQEDPQKLLLDAIPFNTQYKLENRYKMTTTEVVKYDGWRFYWDITLVSRSDTVPLDPALRGNYMTEHFEEHRLWNEHRIFAWDGQKYTTYSASGGQAIVDVANKQSVPAVNGPLTAGLIPWGAGELSSASLLAADVSATSAKRDGLTIVHMSITHSDGSLTELDLDSSKAYAVTSATLTSLDGFEAIYTLADYKSYAGQWVPSSIVIERKNLPKGNKAPTWEQWTIQSVDTAAMSPSNFDVPLALNAVVEYVSPAMATSAIYINSYDVDTDNLLAQRLAYGTAAGKRRQNCATAALQYVASGFGKSVSNAALANLVGPDGRTQLDDMRQLAQSLGLYSRIVKADLATLENLGTAKAILHLPGKKHFVVLDRVDDRYVWLVDLSSRKFYYRENAYFFPMAWTAGTALLVSDRPIATGFSEVPNTAINQISGGGYWDCNRLYQEEYWIGCDQEFGLCGGTYAHYYERWICTMVPEGTCASLNLIRYEESPCIPDPILGCTPNGDLYFYYMRGCQ